MGTTTYDDSDPALVYVGDWKSGIWNAEGQSGNLHVTNDRAANVTFIFPVAATAFSVFGFKRSRGGSYGICVDCNPNATHFLPVDGFDATDNGQNPPVVLYSQNFSAPAVHRIILQNQPDWRGTPPGNSQLALDRIELQLDPQPSAYSSPLSTPLSTRSTPGVSQLSPTITVVITTVQTSASQTTQSAHQHISIGTPSILPIMQSSSITTISQSSTSLSTSSASLTISSSVQNSTSPKSPTAHVGLIVGGILGGLALIIAIFLVMSIIRFRSASKEVRNAENELLESVGQSLPAQWQELPYSRRTSGEGYDTTFSETDSFETLTYGWGTAKIHLKNRTARTDSRELKKG